MNPPATRPSTSRVIPDRVSIVLSASADIGSLRSVRLRQVQQYLVVARGDAVLGDELGVEHPHDRGVALEVASPRLKRRALEARGAVFAGRARPGGDLDRGTCIHVQ